MKNPIFDPQLNTNRLDVSDVKEMPAWMKPVLDFINQIAETIYFAQEFDLETEILSKIPATEEDAVTSVNTKTGAVTLDTDDIPEGTTNKYLTEDPTLNSIKTASSSGLSIKSSTDTEIFKIEDTGQLKAVYESTVGTDYNTTLHNIYGARTWVNFNGTGTVAIRASGNVSSITDNGTGDYTVNFTAALPDADYSLFINTARLAVDAISSYGVVSYSASSVRIQTYNNAIWTIDISDIFLGVIR